MSEVIPKQQKLPFHSYNIDKTLLDTNSKLIGLSEIEVQTKLTELGFNQLPQKQKTPPFVQFIQQFNNPLVIILILVIILSFGLGKNVDAIVISVIVLCNAILGFWQERKAQLAMESLQNLLVPTARVWRDQNIYQIDSKDLVIGDILLLEEGDKIPADARLIEAKNLSTNESTLTGESTTVNKKLDLLPIETDLADQKNMIWSGTFVSTGSGKAVVTNTGSYTILGKIASELQNIQKPNQFNQKIHKLSQQIAILSLILATANYILAIAIGSSPTESIFFAISSLVSGIPEGLPAMLTLVLSIGAKQMTQKNALVRKLEATETIGAVTVIATDKTGTLTTNTMTVNSLQTNSQELQVTGKGWSVDGEFFVNGEITSPDDNSIKLLRIASLCHKAKVEETAQKCEVIGDPTEAGLYVLGRKIGFSKENLSDNFRIIDDIAFNSNLKMRASLIKDETNGDLEMYVIGASETVIENCTHILENETTSETKIFTQEQKNKWLKKIEEQSEKSYRVIGLAYKKIHKNETKNIETEDIHNLVLVGIVSMQDPIREEVPEAVANCKKAGIRIIMMTGDHKSTALSIAKQAGIVDQSEQMAFSEQELNNLSPEELRKVVKHCNVFARCTPERKLQVLQFLQEEGQIVAMTGDGVNDGPALKQADVGISMGKNGTDIARESSEIILTDDNFSTIVQAVKKGRVIYGNLQKAVNLSLCRTLAGMLSLIGATAVLGNLPFSSTQLLWLNLITETIIGISLAFENGDGQEMNQKPIKSNLITKKTTLIVLMTAIWITILTVGSYGIFKNYLPQISTTLAFMIFYFSQIFNLISFRSWSRPFWQLNYTKNPILLPSLFLSFILQFIFIYTPLSKILNFQSINFGYLILTIILASTSLFVGEIAKKVANRID
jgi:P-type Ca2+ transporter type 2C